MASVVFLRAINVGGASLCKPAQLAKDLSRFDVVNIGAVGTFVVRAKVSEPELRKEFAVRLKKDFGIKCEIMIVPAKAIVDLARKDPFVAQLSGPEIVRFVSVLHNRPRKRFSLPLNLPSEGDWLLKVIAIEKQFVLGVYRRQMKAIGYLGKIEKILGQPGTVRNWNTIERVLKVLANA